MKDILQQFDEKFWYLWKVHEDGSQVTVHEDVKSFLEESLKAQKKEIKEMIEKKKLMPFVNEDPFRITYITKLSLKF